MDGAVNDFAIRSIKPRDMRSRIGRETNRGGEISTARSWAPRVPIAVNNQGPKYLPATRALKEMMRDPAQKSRDRG